MAADIRVAVVIGNNRGSPSPAAWRKRGLHVLRAGRSEYAVDRAVAELAKDGHSISGHQLNVKRPGGVARAFADTFKQLGAWTVWFNNAAGDEEERLRPDRRITSQLGPLATRGDTSVSHRVSKAALSALTRVLAAEVAGTGILVNACSTGRMNTRMAGGETDGTPDEGADTPVWLAALLDAGPTGGLFADRVRSTGDVDRSRAEER